MTGLASAWAESRELLIVGGQVKRSDLSRGQVRQRGIQELDGARIAAPLCKRVLAIEAPVSRDAVIDAVREGARPRRGPVFIEMCLDAQAAPALPAQATRATARSPCSRSPSVQ
jgi:acetolactate synthase-1/2/3 large subunit